MPFQIIRNDITKVHADMIVNTANPNVTVGNGVDMAIYTAAGREKLLKERNKIGYLAPGEVAVTPAFNLPAKYIAHSSGPVWQGGNKGEEALLRQCYDKCLAQAKKYRCKTIAFPLMAVGAYGFPHEIGMQIAIDAFTDFLKDNELSITLVIFGGYSLKVSGKWFDEVESFIDDSYVEAAYLEESCYSEYRESREFIEAACLDEALPSIDSEPSQLPRYSVHQRSIGTAHKSSSIFSSKMVGASLEDMLGEMQVDSFESYMLRLINKKGLKNSEVYTAANISKQYFSKLLKGDVKPSKEKILALAIGMQLNMDEAIDFLKFAGYAFSPASKTDVVVQYFIQKKEYSVIKINMVLFDYELPILSN